MNTLDFAVLFLHELFAGDLVPSASLPVLYACPGSRGALGAGGAGAGEASRRRQRGPAQASRGRAEQGKATARNPILDGMAHYSVRKCEHITLSEIFLRSSGYEHLNPRLIELLL